MNQRLMKFTLELQNAEAPVKTTKNIPFKSGNSNNKFLNLIKLAFVTVPFDKQ